jgi:hypothetical protein
VAGWWRGRAQRLDVTERTRGISVRDHISRVRSKSEPRRNGLVAAAVVPRKGCPGSAAEVG